MPKDVTKGKYSPCKYSFASRKFILLVLLIFITFIIITLKINSSTFDSIFKDWCLFLVSIYAIYNGGNVGSKYVNAKSQSSTEE
jgi:hypothetical protein